MPQQIYLAGPMVFYPHPEEIFNEMKKICAAQGLLGVAPIDAQLDLGALAPGRPLFEKIVTADFDLMRRADAAIFCLDSFRGGVEMDAGTAVEIGFMTALGKPMSGWTQDLRTYPEKISDFYSGKITATFANAVGATSGTTRDPEGMLIHSAGLSQHGMAQMPIEIHGGSVFANADWKVAFQQAVVNIREQFDKSPRFNHKPLSISP